MPWNRESPMDQHRLGRRDATLGHWSIPWKKSTFYRSSESAQERLWRADEADVDLPILVVNQRR